MPNRFTISLRASAITMVVAALGWSVLGVAHYSAREKLGIVPTIYSFGFSIAFAWLAWRAFRGRTWAAVAAFWLWLATLLLSIGISLNAGDPAVFLRGLVPMVILGVLFALGMRGASAGESMDRGS